MDVPCGVMLNYDHAAYRNDACSQPPRVMGMCYNLAMEGTLKTVPKSKKHWPLRCRKRRLSNLAGRLRQNVVQEFAAIISCPSAVARRSTDDRMLRAPYRSAPR